ncbi:MAG: ATP-binding cassette domain-containing protein [Candidatus Aureabacteria bacterium]|nr:ATP-binding cassette domain-containing protein [Candidatus Auribacterota bacterium]
MIPLIEIIHLSLKREKTILQDISWSVHEGEHWVILGANGSGKTSLLSAISAYRSLSSGIIRFLGHEYGSSDWTVLRKKIGFASSSLISKMQTSMTALEVVMSGQHAKLMNWDAPSEKEKAKALGILDLVECRSLQNRPWFSLSQGEQQRVWIGRAIMADSAILFLDEPCAGLDPVARDKFLHSVNRMALKKGPALVLVTHHVEEIMPCFSHVLFMKKGTILASGKKEQILTSANLSKAFGQKISLKKSKGRYRIEMKSP